MKKLIFLLPFIHSCYSYECIDDEYRYFTDKESVFVPYSLNDSIIMNNNDLEKFQMKCTYETYHERHRENFYSVCYDAEAYEKIYSYKFSRLSTNLPYFKNSHLIIDITVSTKDQIENEINSYVVFGFTSSNRDLHWDYFRDSIGGYFEATNFRVKIDSATRNETIISKIYTELLLNNKIYSDVYEIIFHNSMAFYDTLYYNNEFGFIRFCGENLRYNLAEYLVHD